MNQLNFKFLQQKNHHRFISLLLFLKVLLAALNFANFLKIKKRLENKKTLKT